MAKRDASIPKNIVKSHLKLHMRGRISFLQSEVQKGINSILDTTLDPILATMFNEFAEMERHAQRYVELATDYLATQLHVGYAVRDAVTYTNTHYCGIRNDKRRNLKNIIANVIAKPEHEAFVNDNRQLVETVHVLQGTMKPFYEKMNQLESLGTDIYNIIDAAKSGKEAFIRLREMGVDMTDYRRDETLPTVVKLQNVCLINQNCEEEKA